MTIQRSANTDHLKPKNIIKAFNPKMGQQELMERAALMQEEKCTGQKIKELNARWSK